MVSSSAQTYEPYQSKVNEISRKNSIKNTEFNVNQYIPTTRATIRESKPDFSRLEGTILILFHNFHEYLMLQCPYNLYFQPQ